MSKELKDKYGKKLKEFEDKIAELNIHKNILNSAAIEIGKGGNIHLNNALFGLDLQNEISYLADWIEFYSNNVENCRLKLKKMELENTYTLKPVAIQDQPIAFSSSKKLNNKKILIKYVIPVFVLFILAAFLLLLRPSITGHVVVEKDIKYDKTLNLVLNASGNYTFDLDKPGKITSIMATGSVKGNGTARAYIEKDGKRYLIFENKQK